MSYTSHLLDLLVAAPQPLVTKVDCVMARLQARIKQSLQVRLTSCHIIIMLLFSVTDTSSVAEPA